MIELDPLVEAQACLTFAWISMPIAPAPGGECVIGSSTKIAWLHQDLACGDEASRPVLSLIAALVEARGGGTTEQNHSGR